MPLERWHTPRREVVLGVALVPSHHVITTKWGARYAIDAASFRFRAPDWDGEWKLIQETLYAVGRHDRPMYGPMVASVPEWLANLREKALLEVQLHG